MANNKTGEEYAASKYHEFRVHEDCTLTEFILRQMSGISRNRLKDLLRGHAVSVDRRLTTQYDYPLRAGQTVRITKHRRATELQNRFVKIIYEDKDIVVIEKAVGILSMAATAKQYCVKTVLDEYFRKRHFKCYAHVVHRLDRDTSGLMVYAKTIEAAAALEADWKQMVYDRRYVAVLAGDMPQEGGTVHNWLKDNKAYITYASDVEGDGKEAITHYRRIKTNGEYTLCEMRLETGRKNQIRVHMADLGYPILGDVKYGNGADPLHRLCLHAYRLYMIHPRTGERLQFETPFPTPFNRLLVKQNNNEQQ